MKHAKCHVVVVAICAASLGASSAMASPSLSAEALLPGTGNRDAYRPAVAFGAGKSLVVWQAGRLGTGDLVGLRLDGAGAPIDAAPFVVSNAADDQERPQIAFGGGVYLVVWQDLRNGKDYDTYAARVTPDGKTLDPGGVLVSGGPHNQSLPVVTFDGTSFLVVWEDFRSGRYEIYGSRVGTDGTVTDPLGILVANKAGAHRVMPSVASQGGQSFVLWHESNGYYSSTGTLFGGTFVKNGVVGKTVDLTPQVPSPQDYFLPGTGCATTLVSGPSGFFATWRNFAPVGRASPSRNANTALLSPDGNLLGTPTFLLGHEHFIVDPNSVWDGGQFVSAWAEQRHDPSGPPATPDFDAVYAVVTNADGTVGSAEIPVAGTLANPAKNAAVASDGAHHTVIVYERHPSVGSQAIRVGTRLLQAP